jgi:hypothetical protein
MNWNDKREEYDEIGMERVRAYMERLARKRAARDAAAEPAVGPSAAAGDSPCELVGEAIHPCRTS